MCYITLQLRIPGALFDLATDRLPGFLKLTGGSLGKMSSRVKVNKPIQSSPTKDARMSVMIASRARFPDAFVRILPTAANVIADGAEHPSRLSVQYAARADEM